MQSGVFKWKHSLVLNILKSITVTCPTDPRFEFAQPGYLVEAGKLQACKSLARGAVNKVVRSRITSHLAYHINAGAICA